MRVVVVLLLPEASQIPTAMIILAVHTYRREGRVEVAGSPLPITAREERQCGLQEGERLGGGGWYQRNPQGTPGWVPRDSCTRSSSKGRRAHPERLLGPSGTHKAPLSLGGYLSSLRAGEF